MFRFEWGELGVFRAYFTEYADLGLMMRLTSELDELTFRWWMGWIFSQSEFSTILVQGTETSRQIGKLVSGWTSNRKLVSYRFLWWNLMRLMKLFSYWWYFSSYWWYFSLTDDTFSGWKFLYQLSDSDLSAIRIDLHKNPAIATVRSPMSISVSQSQSYHEFALQGVSKEGCATVQISNEQRRGAGNSSNLILWAEKEARVCKSQKMIKEGSSCLQKSHMSKRRAKSSSKSPMMNSMSRKGSSCLQISNEHQKWFFQRKIYQFQRKIYSLWNMYHIDKRGHTHIYTETETHTYTENFFTRIWKRNFSSLNSWT